MKRISDVLGAVGTALLFLSDIAKILIVPLMLVICGVLNGYSWQYYVISIGLCAVIWIFLEIVLFLIFRALKKAYTPLLIKMVKKYFVK